MRPDLVGSQCVVAPTEQVNREPIDDPSKLRKTLHNVPSRSPSECTLCKGSRAMLSHWPGTMNAEHKKAHARDSRLEPVERRVRRHRFHILNRAAVLAGAGAL
jgi:hypothetical protein